MRIEEGRKRLKEVKREAKIMIIRKISEKSNKKSKRNVRKS